MSTKVLLYLLLSLTIVSFSGCLDSSSYPSSKVSERQSFPDITIPIPHEILSLSKNDTVTPIQTSIKSSKFSIHPGDAVTPIATFQLQGRVLMKKCYNDRNTQYYPCDLAIGWNDMAKPEVYSKMSLRQSNRFWHFRYQYEDLDVKPSVISAQASNMHIIPADPTIQDIVNKIRPGDIIQLSGLLVNIENEQGMKWRSSTTRTDTGNGACEIIYTQELRIL